MANIVLVNPRFEVSYWGMEYALPILGKKAAMPTASLPAVAAQTPPEHAITLIDENVEAIDFEQVARADVVGLTGMIVQRRRMREILMELKRRRVFTVVGGPWVTLREDYFGDLADVIFVGEAEETWPRFLSDWQAGRTQRRYEQADRTDMTRVPAPRLDLLKMQHYAYGSVQFSRGCPFQCEFCDIIVTFGRRPRLKTSDQVITELEALRRHGMRIAFVVDDNLIGNKKAIKLLLAELAGWQKVNGYPLILFTEASLDLAEDAELMRLMVDANFHVVFVGIESPNEESLRETRKHQNIRTGATLVERVHAIQQAGLEVWCGMILGFDHDDLGIFEAQRRFLHAAHIAHAMLGMLTALPKTPLYERLVVQHRLDDADVSPFGTNVIPQQMTRQELRDGFVELMQDLYKPEAYFDRVEGLYADPRFNPAQALKRYWRDHFLSGLRGRLEHGFAALAMYLRLRWHVRDENLLGAYQRRMLRLMRARRDPTALMIYTIKCAMHYHHYTMSKNMNDAVSVRNIF